MALSEDVLTATASNHTGGRSQFVFPNDLAKETSLLRAVVEAEHIRRQDKHYLREYASWIHPIRSRSRDGVPGYSKGYLGVEDIWSPDLIMNDESIRITQTGAIVTERNRPIEWIDAGINMGQTMVEIAKKGINAAIIHHPLSITHIRDRIESVLDTSSSVQVLIRFGTAVRTPYTQRRPINDVMLHPGFSR